MNRQFCVIDAEGERDALDGVAFYSDALKEYLTDHAAIRSELLNHAQDGYTFAAHNAGYDLPVIFWTLDIPMRAVYYDGHFNRGQWKWHPKRPLCELWDTLNLSGNISVESLGTALQLPKYPTPQKLLGIDPDRFEWKCATHDVWECVSCYALRDAEIVYRYLESMERVVTAWGVPMKPRIAAIAQAVWRVLDRPEPIALTDKRMRHMGRKSFYGGRVECFRLGHVTPLYTADVVSMYPSVMASGLFPDPASMVYAQDIPVSQLPLECEGVCEALVSVSARGVPPLPHSHKGLRVFATGLLRGYWTLAELRYALSRGCQLHRVYRAAWGTRSYSPFTTLIGVLWEMREEYKRHGDPRSQTVKVLMNSCYGRLGLRNDGEREFIEPWDPSLTMEDYAKKARGKHQKRSRRPNGSLAPELGVYAEVVNGAPFVRWGTPIPFDHTWVNVIWAAQITALARIRLHSHLLAQGDGLVYCDTDSVFSTRPIVGLGTGLGSLSDQQSYARGWIVGPKLYCLESHDGVEHPRAKGVPRKYALAFLRGEEVVFPSPVSPRSQRHGGPPAGKWVEIHRERQLVPYRRVPIHLEQLQLEYGWSDTIPLHIGPGV